MKKIISKIKTLIDIIITYPIYFLSFLFPKNKKIWVFIGWHLKNNGEIFADNTKYLFLYTSQNEKNIKAIWLAKNKKLAKKLNKLGYISYYDKSLKGIYYALRAKYTIIDAYLQRQNFRYTGGSKIIQLLHGKGMKKGGYAKKILKHNDYIFTTSNFTINLLPESFTKNSKCIVSGFSRDDSFFTEIKNSEIDTDIICLKKISPNTLKRVVGIKESNTENKNILYAPTFRRNMKNFDLESILNLQNWLKENAYSLFISLHSKYRIQKRLENSKNIFFIKDCDITPLLKYFDLLITDYSSIFTDFLLTNNRIIFYPFDLQDYKQKEGLCFDYNKFTPGPKVFNITELKKELNEVFIEDKYQEKRLEIKNLYHKYTDKNASQRIIETIKKEENLNF